MATLSAPSGGRDEPYVRYDNLSLHRQGAENGYALTLPEANRIGINLKWLLASCYMISGKVDTPTM